MKAGTLSRACTEGCALTDRDLKRLTAVCFSGVKTLDSFNRRGEGMRRASRRDVGADRRSALRVIKTILRPMSSRIAKRRACREDLGLDKLEYAILRRLRTPQQIQAFVNALPINHEIGGETVFSVRQVLAYRRAHCIEAALLAACALWIQGEPPLVMRLDCDASDYPHVLALFRRRACWGAISKSNGIALRYRDPIYRSLRELAISYFHEYSTAGGRKTLRSYAVPLDLRRVDPRLWITADGCWELHDQLEHRRHYPLISARQQKLLSRRDAFERASARIVQFPKGARQR